jgi:hypothetical protein
MRLSEKERQDALIIIETLRLVESCKNKGSLPDTLVSAQRFFNSGNLRLEYLAVVDLACSFKMDTSLSHLG